MHHGYLEKKITQAVESDHPPQKHFFLILYLSVYRMLTDMRIRSILQHSLLPNSSTNYNNEAATDA